MGKSASEISVTSASASASSFAASAASRALKEPVRTEPASTRILGAAIGGHWPGFLTVSTRPGLIFVPPPLFRPLPIRPVLAAGLKTAGGPNLCAIAARFCEKSGLGLEKRNLGRDQVARHQAGDDADLFGRRLAHAAAPGRAVGEQGLDLLAHQAGNVFVGGPRRHAQADLVGPVFAASQGRPMQRGQTDDVDAHLGKPIGEPLAHDLAGLLGARHAVLPGVADLALAEETGPIADAHFEPPRARPPAGA